MQNPQLSGLSLWPQEACLISELAAELISLGESALAGLTIVLPTKRLATWLVALLSQHWQAFVPPRFFNFDEFIAYFAAHPDLAGAELQAVVSDLTEELLLAELLRQNDYKHLRPGHEHEARQLFTELASWHIDDAAFRSLADNLAGDLSRSEATLASITERLTELDDLYRAFLSALETKSATTTARESARLSLALAKALEDRRRLAAQGHVYIVGFTSMVGVHHPLLAKLANLEDVSIWLSSAPKLFGEKNPLALLQEALSTGGQLRSMQRKPSAPKITRVHVAPTALSEVAAAVSLVQDTMAAGVPPSQIAILVTSDTAYGKMLRTMLRVSNLECNMAIGTPLSQTMLGTWLTALVNIVTSGQETSRLMSFLTHPLTGRTLFKTQLQQSDEQVQATFERLIREVALSEIDRGILHLAGSPKLSSASQQVFLQAYEIIKVLIEHDGFLSLEEWQQRLITAIAPFLEEAVAWQPHTEQLGIWQTALENIENFMTALASVVPNSSARITHSEFFALLREKLLSREVRSVGDPLCGIQVLSVSEARYVPFRVAIVLGVSEGNFPKALPKDHLLDNYLKAKMGLPGWQLLEGMEDTTYHLLRARLPALELFYPRTIGLEPAVRSRFIERLITAEGLREVEHDDDQQLLSVLSGYLTSSASLPTLDLSARLAPAGLSGVGRSYALDPISAGALEKLIRCPYQFLLSRLDVSEVDFAKADDTRREGDWLHSVLEAFFTGKAGRQTIDVPLDRDSGSEDFESFAVARLRRISDKLAPAHIKDSPVYLHITFHSWPAFAAHIARLYRETGLRQTTAGLREFALGNRPNAPAPQLDINGHTISLKGFIDSVDHLEDFHLITDYKRNSSPERHEVKDGLSPQLLLYALALDALMLQNQQRSMPLSQAIAGYWSILKGTWVAVGAGSEVLARAKQLGLVSSREQNTLEDMTQQLKNLWTWRLKNLVSDEQPFAPDPSACGYCSFAGACRRDDPALSAAIAKGNELARYLGPARGPQEPNA